MATIKDIARAANVSVSTVSNIINNRKNVSLEICNRVTKVMKELNYRPSLLAMNLKRNKLDFIGVLVPSVNGYYGQMLQGILQITEENKSQLVVKSINEIRKDEKQKIVDLLQLGVKGVIIVSPNIDEELVNAITEYGCPFVLLDHHLLHKDCNIVKFDNEQIVEDLTERIISENPKYIGLLTGPQSNGSESDCINGLRRALQKSNFPEENVMVLETELVKERSFQMVFNRLSECEFIPSHFIVTNEFVAESLLEAVSLLGYKDIKIYTLSGDSWCISDNHVNLIKIRRNAIQLGIEAAKLLIEQINLSVISDSRQIKVENIYNFEKKQLIKIEKRDKKIRALILDDPMSGAFVKLLPDFVNKTGITFEFDYASQRDLQKIIIEKFKKQDTIYDIYMIDMPWLPSLINKKCLLRLNDIMDIRGISEDYVDIIKSVFFNDNDNVYAIPVDVGNQVLAYRCDLFEDQSIQRQYFDKYGIELQLPRNWTEFNLIAKFFTREYNPDSPCKYGTCLLGYNPTGLIEEFLPRQWSYNGKMFSGNEAAINSVQNVKALRNLCESFKYSFPDCENYMEDEQIKVFLNNDIAMIATFNIHISKHQRYHVGSSKDNIKFNIMPGGISLMGGWLLGINAFTKNPDLSAQFIEWAIDDNISIQSSILGAIIPKKNVFFNNEVNAVFPWLRDIDWHLGNSRVREIIKNRRGKILNNNDFEDILGNAIQSAINDEITPEEALMKTQEEFKKMMNL